MDVNTDSTASQSNPWYRTLEVMILSVIAVLCIGSVVYLFLFARSPACFPSSVPALYPGTHALGTQTSGGASSQWTTTTYVYVVDAALGEVQQHYEREMTTYCQSALWTMDDAHDCASRGLCRHAHCILKQIDDYATHDFSLRLHALANQKTEVIQVDTFATKC